MLIDLNAPEIQYGTPAHQGTYVCYVNDDDEPKMPAARRVLLLWYGGRWAYPFSSEYYRGHVYGFIGPLPVLRLED